ncbi:YetF domain-containing protein [uncultured Pontibacter sp.]|uniref:DUF421 domain-containing protein n=1 Tax=uncultured Pontibacter sp. TaxID=453356 RepID=UPI002617F961|nr:YetF domain-containing protein [uncultured Pontibacter sp.]
MQEAIDTFNLLFGIGEGTLNWWQMSLRAVGVFFAALAIMRIGSHRIFGKNTAFDIVLGIIYGSILSRAITGNAPFWPTLAAALTLVLLHKLLATVAFNTENGFGNIIKGKPQELVKDGEVRWEVMRSNSVTENDLLEAMRNSGHRPEISAIHKAYLERNGDISIICKEED